jgi:hypothetical protein
MNYKVLLINHKVKQCGVYQYGKRLFDILVKSNNLKYIYVEIESLKEYKDIIIKKYCKEDVKCIIYNYHIATLQWLSIKTIQKEITNIGILHDNKENDIFDIVFNINISDADDIDKKIFTIPRPIFENVEEIISTSKISVENKNFIHSYTNTNIPIFGSFGFGFETKGFEKIVSLINEQYDNAVIKFVIPASSFDPNKDTQFLMRNKCLKLNKKKSSITLLISHNFFSTGEILSFLRSNTMNIFLYDYLEGRGPSSTIDYAVSVKKPIGISDSYMFRHIYADDICLYKNTVEYCKEKSFDICNRFLEENSNERLINKIDEIILQNIYENEKPDENCEKMNDNEKMNNNDILI